ncbi:hypothetical protein AVEN_127739-1 [Araneus ventricosus]|uniref:Uncharacterized protein n=1 Tax=Araneus ventricosus TaxID=182803 RepID=A0A4Y2EDC0_ARAVE|nr:hypothetical protein AVEN_127739-1 [Araneus ventricosus]
MSKHPGKQLKDRPPQEIVSHCGSCIIIPITSSSCSNPPFYRGTTHHRKWAQRATPPLLCHRVDESLLTYTAASHGVPPMGKLCIYRMLRYWTDKLRGMLVDINWDKICNATRCRKRRSEGKIAENA